MLPGRPRRFLLTNDDGIDSPGLAALESALPSDAKVIVVAPTAERSGCGHQVTTGRPFRTSRLAEDRIAVDAAPADCVRVAIHDFRARFDWVLAGINHGANLGADIYYSGTVAAVREAALLGIPAVAVSHYRDRVLSERDWQRAAGWVRAILPDLFARPQGQGVHWNVNLPCLHLGADTPPVEHCDIDTSPLQLAYAIDRDRYTYTGSYHHRGRQPGRDVELCFGGKIAISGLTLP